jgi:hypothetical protein
VVDREFPGEFGRIAKDAAYKRSSRLVILEDSRMTLDMDTIIVCCVLSREIAEAGASQDPRQPVAK